MQLVKKIATAKMLEKYKEHLKHEERSRNTQEKYERDIQRFLEFVGKKQITKELTVAYKQYLKDEGYEPASINSMLAAVNGFLSYFGWSECRVKRLAIQRNTFSSIETELSRKEYIKLLEASKKQKQERINLITKTICGTGIRVSELKYITVEAVRNGQAVVECKGKVRLVFIAKELQSQLRLFCRKQGLTTGSVFVTKTGKPMNRSNIWRAMKALCIEAGVDSKKVFPHNLRHLFAKTFYELEKDIAKLADILGHSSIETTRIYILSFRTDHLRQVERLDLVV